MNIEEMADFLGFLGATLCEVPLTNHLTWFEYCAQHNCNECAMRYLQQESEIKKDV